MASLTAIAVIGVITPACPNDERGVAVITQSVREDGLVLRVDVERSDAGIVALVGTRKRRPN